LHNKLIYIWFSFDIIIIYHTILCSSDYLYILRGRRGRDRIAVGFTTTCATSVYHHWSCEL